MTGMGRGLVLAVLMCALVACGGGGGDSASKSPALQAAFDKCSPVDATVTVSDGGHSLLVEGLSTHRAANSLRCVLDGISTPEYVYSEIDNTTAMSGTRTEDVGGFHYEWTYHPDNGLDMVVHDGG